MYLLTKFHSLFFSPLFFSPSFLQNMSIKNAGAAVIVYGAASFGSSGYINLPDLTAKEGLIITGDEVASQTGHSVSLLGDVDGDGYNDVMIGATEAHGDQSEDSTTITGACYVFTSLSKKKKHPHDEIDYFPFILLGIIVGSIGCMMLACRYCKHHDDDDISVGGDKFLPLNSESEESFQQINKDKDGSTDGVNQQPVKWNEKHDDYGDEVENSNGGGYTPPLN
jgi:hypothetical protein